MGLSKASRFARGMWLVAAVVVCVGAFLSVLPTELDVSTALAPAHSSPLLDQEASEGYLAVAREEAGQADKVPGNADLLTMLVLGVSSSFFGLSFGLLLTNSQRQGASCSLIVLGPSLASAREDLSSLGVFRL
jgi:hypothetical protein